MNQNKNSTLKCLSELPFIFCGKSGDIEVYEDTEPELIEHMIAICRICNVTLRIIKREIPLCPTCNKPLTRNGTKTSDLNNEDSIKLQKYNHENCKNSSCICSTKAFKQEHCTYSKKVQENSVTINLVNPESYQKKAEELAYNTGAYPHRSTLFYYHKIYSEELFEYLEHLQYKRIEELEIKPSGTYCFDEQFVFVNKKLLLRLSLIDHHNKLIMGDILVSHEEYNNEIIETFLRSCLENQPLKTIVTDGRQGYRTIIEAVGAIQHRCFFHIMQNLMTPLQKHINKLNNKVETIENRIQDKNNKIKEIRQNKKKYTGPIPHDDKKTTKQQNDIKDLGNEIRELKKEKSEINKELKVIDYDKNRVHRIWESKTEKQAKRRYNTIYNQKDQLNPIIAKFLEKIKSNLDVMLNHIEDPEIPATNNTIENYYRTTLPRSQKRIFRTKEGLQRRIREQQIRWTHRVILKQHTPLNKNTTYN